MASLNRKIHLPSNKSLGSLSNIIVLVVLKSIPRLAYTFLWVGNGIQSLPGGNAAPLENQWEVATPLLCYNFKNHTSYLGFLQRVTWVAEMIWFQVQLKFQISSTFNDRRRYTLSNVNYSLKVIDIQDPSYTWGWKTHSRLIQLAGPSALPVLQILLAFPLALQSLLYALPRW